METLVHGAFERILRKCLVDVVLGILLHLEARLLRTAAVAFSL